MTYEAMMQHISTFCLAQYGKNYGTVFVTIYHQILIVQYYDVLRHRISTK